MSSDREPRWEPDCDGPARGPALDWERRVFVVGIAYAVPGALLGGLASVILSAAAGPLSAAPLALGGLAGFLAGGLIEGLGD
jgi:hypothetical protein